ncbi:hypothetical protein Tco_1046074 [Tanacetum coccineum]
MSPIRAGKLVASWCTIVRFPESSDPDEARHIERRGSIPSRQVRGKKKDKSIQLLSLPRREVSRVLLSLPRGEVSRVRESLVKMMLLLNAILFGTAKTC